MKHAQVKEPRMAPPTFRLRAGKIVVMVMVRFVGTSVFINSKASFLSMNAKRFALKFRENAIKCASQDSTNVDSEQRLSVRKRRTEHCTELVEINVSQT